MLGLDSLGCAVAEGGCGSAVGDGVAAELADGVAEGPGDRVADTVVGPTPVAGRVDSFDITTTPMTSPASTTASAAPATAAEVVRCQGVAVGIGAVGRSSTSTVA